MKVVSLGVYHQGCWGSFIPEKFPEIKMTESGPVQILQKKKELAKVQTCWKIEARDPKTLDSLITDMKNESCIKEIVPFYKKGNKALVFTRWNGPGSSYDVIVNRKSMIISPVVQENGYEKFQILTKKPQEVKNLLNELGMIGETKVYSISDFKDKEDNKLTEKQLRAINTAKQNGYYSWPRKATLEKLAEIVGCSRRAFQENLRKAEAKALPDLINTIRA